MNNMTNTSELETEVGTEMLMTPGKYLTAAIVLILIGIFGSVFNLSIIILMWKDKQLWSPLNIILFNIICSDFAVSVLGTPLTLTSALSHRWVFGMTMCTCYGFFMALLGIACITTLTVLAFERYMIVSRPLRNRGLSREKAIYLVGGIWIYSLVLTVPPLLGWGQYVHEAADISCSINWEEQTTNAMTYIVYLFTFGLILPLIVIVFSYANIIITMKKNKINTGQTSKAESRVTLMILLMIMAFLVAWSPYAVCALLVQFGDPSLVPPAAGVVPALVAKSSICYNPVIYVGLNSQFRNVLKEKLRLKETRNESCETHGMTVTRFISHVVPNIGENNLKMIRETGVIQIHHTKQQAPLLEER